MPQMIHKGIFVTDLPFNSKVSAMPFVISSRLDPSRRSRGVALALWLVPSHALQARQGTDLGGGRGVGGGCLGRGQTCLFGRGFPENDRNSGQKTHFQNHLFGFQFCQGKWLDPLDINMPREMGLIFERLDCLTLWTSVFQPFWRVFHIRIAIAECPLGRMSLGSSVLWSLL